MTVRSRLVVVGSANMDLVVRVERLPAPGETVLGGQFVTVAGGKGANQAVAAARLGGDVRFVGCVGSDAFGDGLLNGMHEAGIDTSHVRRDSIRPSGVALIGVDAGGQNAIIVAPGANGSLSPGDVDAARASIAAADYVVLQLEIPLDVVVRAVALANEVGKRVLLNPAPVRVSDPLPAGLLQGVDVLTPNEHEAANLLGYSDAEGLDMEEVAMRLCALGPRHVVVTLGGDGCLLATSRGVLRLPAVPVTPVDTTAAGDCFTGALAVALGEGRDIEAASRFASRAAALSVTRPGAQPSLPWRVEIQE